MHNLIDFFRGNNAEAIEEVLCEAEQVVVVDWSEEDDIIVHDFADFVPGLTCRRVANNDLEISFQSRTLHAGLQGHPSDRDRTLRAIRDAIKPDYEIRVLRSSLGTDTLALVVDKPSVWQQIEVQSPKHLHELFAPFTDEIGFGDDDE